MADQNCAHAGCTCKVEQGKGVSRAMILTAAIIARMLAHLVRESVNVVIRIAGRIRGMAEEIRHPHFEMKKRKSNSRSRRPMEGPQSGNIT